MICPTCGYENGKEDNYCDECGAQLKLEQVSEDKKATEGGPLKVGQIVWQHYEVISILQSDADCIFYELKDLEAANKAASAHEQPKDEEGIPNRLLKRVKRNLSLPIQFVKRKKATFCFVSSLPILLKRPKYLLIFLLLNMSVCGLFGI